MVEEPSHVKQPSLSHMGKIGSNKAKIAELRMIAILSLYYLFGPDASLACILS
jgi:hypothetical protein